MRRRPGTGHVNVIDVVGADGKLTAVEQNQAGRNSWYTMSCGKCFLHVVANDGTNMGGTIGAGSGGKGAAGMGAGGAGGASAMTGSGGMFAPPWKPAGQAGTSASPPVTPVMNMPMMQAPVTPPPAMTTPASTVPAGTGGVNAGSGGAAAMQPSTFSVPPRRQVQEPAGCSVVHANADTHGGAGFGLLGLALIARRLLRARIARPRVSRRTRRHSGAVATRKKLDDQLAALQALRDAPDTPAARAELQHALEGRSSALATAAANIIGGAELRGFEPALIAAFERFMHQPEKTDKGCAAKQAIARACIARRPTAMRCCCGDATSSSSQSGAASRTWRSSCARRARSRWCKTTIRT